MAAQAGRIRIGVGGWIYEPWQGRFYPPGLKPAEELAYASRKLTSIEINGTYYRSQTPETFAKWRDATPADFVFALKAPRFATNRRVLAEAGPSIERFFSGGVMELGDKLGPINWQFMPTKAFDPDDFARFLRLLPAEVAGRPIRHAVEVRHDSFRTPDFVALAREHGVAIVLAGDSAYPQLADPTASFVYARIMGTSEAAVAGYGDDAVAAWTRRLHRWAAGKAAEDLPLLARASAARRGRDVFLYVISGFKERNPLAAMAMIERLGSAAAG